MRSWALGAMGVVMRSTGTAGCAHAFPPAPFDRRDDGGLIAAAAHQQDRPVTG
jgi:hypothetical protein